MTTLTAIPRFTCPGCHHDWLVLVDDTGLCIDCDSHIPDQTPGHDMTTTSKDSSQPPLTPEQHLTVVKHLAAGKNVDHTAAIMRLPRLQVLDIGSHHGYPDANKLAWAADILAKKLDDDRTTAAISTTATSPSGVRLEVEPTRPPQAPPQAPPAAAAAPAAVTSPARPDEFRVLIDTAKGIDSKRIQNLANKVLDDVAKLRGLVDNHQRNLRAQKEAEQQKAAARAEVERLEAQLAAARAKLRPAAPARTHIITDQGGGPSSQQIRAWAVEQNIACPKVGRVPASVRQAYEEAHQGDAA